MQGTIKKGEVQQMKFTYTLNTEKGGET